MKDNNRNANHTNVILNSTSRGCKAEPYPFSASAVFQELKKDKMLKQVQHDNIRRHPEGDNPKDLQTQNHVITRNNVEQVVQKSIQSDVVIPNKLDNGETCKELLRRFVHKITNNNEISPHNDMKNKNGKELINLSTYRLIDFKQPAFTLAETLITLGIIGVVAALTIPGLMTNYKKHKIETKLTKAVSTLNQAIKMSEAENGEMEIWDKNLPYDEFINKYLRPYMKVEQICNSKNPCGYKNIGLTWKYLDGTENGTYCSPFNFKRSGFISTDGVFYVFAYRNTGETGVQDNDKIIIIDINGSEKPNVMGQDVFFLKRIEAEDSILPWGADKGMTTITKNCSKKGSGHYCAALIRANGWKIPNNYPL